MNWMFWRRREIELARGAVAQARQSRDDVDRLTKDLRKRSKDNKFAPLLIRAFRGDG